MKFNSWAWRFACVWLASVPLVYATESSSVRLSLQNTGFDPDAAGSIVSALKEQRGTVTARFSGLAPGGIYTLQVGVVPEASFTADSRGKGKLLFSTKPKSGGLALDFDPRGQEVVLLNGTNQVLQAVLSGEGEPSESSVDERSELERLAGTGSATARYKARNGTEVFTVSLTRITGTNWSLFVAGVYRGDIPIRGTRGKLVFEAPSFDPRGQTIDILQETNLMFSGVLEADIRNVNIATPRVTLFSLPSTGADPDGSAEAKLRLNPDASLKFSIELEDVPVGAYELLADGILQGLITVAENEGETEGEIEFFNRPDDDGDELPMAFDPTNTLFVIQREATVYFQGMLTTATPGGTNAEPTLIQEVLTSTGLDADASGGAEFEIDDQGRRRFDVEIEDVAAGSYALWVGGVNRGTIVAQFDGAQVRGELEFETPTDDSGKLPLNFEPRGALIEVKSGTETLFSHLFGIGATNGASGVPLHVDLPLFNLGEAPLATARAEFKRDEDGERSFEIEIEDTPAGNYTLLVNEVIRGTIVVAATSDGTRGRIEFEDEDDDGSLPLEFEPLGATIRIEREGAGYFERTLPSE